MKLTDDEIKDYQRIWKEEFGEEITLEEAKEYGENLVALIEQIIP